MARVLLVEYDQTWRHIASEGLNAYRTEFCSSLNEAYKRLEKEAFDAIVVSIESNCDDNIRNLKGKLPPHTPLLVVSEQTKTETVVQAIRAGADYVVVGRPIRDAADPIPIIEAMQEEIASTL